MHLATKKLFSSQVICCIDASDKDNPTGPELITQLLKHKFKGAILPVSKQTNCVGGILCYPDLSHLPKKPDIAIFCKETPNLFEQVTELIQLGCQAILFLGDSFTSPMHERKWQKIKQACHDAQVLFFGPTQFGLIFPNYNLHASLCPVPVKSGNIAFISHSETMCQHVIDWAYDKQVGLSACLSLEQSDTLSLTLWLDTLSLDPNTKAIVLYLNEITDARAFMSAARSASHLTKILVMHPTQNLKPEHALKQTSDQYQASLIFDSMIARAGMLRVYTTHELFAALGTLNHAQSLKGDKGIVLLSNSHALSNMAIDAFNKEEQPFTQLSQDQIDQIKLQSKNLEPQYLSEGILQLTPNATDEDFLNLCQILNDQFISSAVLLLHSPTLNSASDSCAQKITSQFKKIPQSKRIKLLSHFAGEYRAKEARQHLNQATIPTYRTPEGAVCAYLHLVHYRENQIQLKQTPASISLPNAHARNQASSWLELQIKQGIKRWSSDTLEFFLSCYQIKLLPTLLINNLEEAKSGAAHFNSSVVLKLWGCVPDKNINYSHIKRFLSTENQIEEAYYVLQYKMKLRADFESQMFMQPMLHEDRSVIARIRVRVDPIFGPVLFIGQASSLARPDKDLVVALLPLNMALANVLIKELIHKIQTDQNRAAQIKVPQSLAQLLVQLSQMMLDHPQIGSFDCHCIIDSQGKVTLVDADMRSLQSNQTRTKFAIKPYPVELERTVQVKEELIDLRPIQPEDEADIDAFIQSVNPEDRYKRFFSAQQRFNHNALAKLTQIDYDREMAFLALPSYHSNHQFLSQSSSKILGVVRIIREPQTQIGEFSILVNSSLKGKGIGKALMQAIIDYARQRQFKEIKGMTMLTNQGMIGLAKALGFDVQLDFKDDVAYLSYIL